jgi:ABC-2 type transport system ATP-binding protein
MDEADHIADRVAVIDHGKIIATGTPEELKKRTETKTLEEAFLKLTGSVIRDENSTSADKMRQLRRVWRR